MNPIDELRAARPAHLDGGQVDELTRATELARAMSEPRQSTSRRGIVRPAWGLGLAGGAAAVTAAVVVVSGNGAVPTTSPSPAPGTPGVAASVTRTSAPRVALPARQVLLAAAENAARQDEGSGDYWHSESVSRMIHTVEDGGYRVVDRTRTEGWTPSAVGGEQWSRSRSLGAEPATEQDREAWERAGSPSAFNAVIPGKGRGKEKYGAIPLSTSPRAARTERSPLVDGDKVFWLGRNVTMKDLRGLPDDPAKLKKWLMASYEGHGTEGDGQEMSGDVWLFTVSMGLIMDMPVTPEVRGAAFRMLAELDEAKVTANVTDAEGRQGTAVSVEEPTHGGGIDEKRLVFDEATGRALARENVVVKAGTFQAGLEPGTVWTSEVLIGSGWTDAAPKGS
ncbi:hypothetical protein GCM10009733_091650 [Nonomuraea maheshkhaliensis]|uniref:CU044_5270 family protein n=1 Tax=Nonomuraea maheshkhaliensis TaxID=419590 RepID=A0ABN2H2T3_9ACTN